MPSALPRLFSSILLAALVVMAGDAAADRGGKDRGNGPDRAAGFDDRGSRMDRAGDDRHDRREDHRALSDAVRRVERRTGGQVLSAERVPFDGRDVNRVKVVDSSGRVRVYMDDPQAGRDDDE